MPDLVVLVSDHTWPRLDVERSILSDVGARIIEPTEDSEASIAEAAADADAILTCFAPITARVIRASPRLQIVGRYGIGVDNIDVACATSQGILVTNVPDYCIDEVATHTLALLLSLARGITRFDRGVRAGDWGLLQGEPLRRLSGSTLGLIGLGSIGRAVAKKGIGIGMSVLGFDPSFQESATDTLGVGLVSMEELVNRSDFVSLHAPLTERTSQMVDASFLRGMKPSAYLINAARGGLVNQAALVQALNERWIAGAAVDVVTPERLVPDDPLLQTTNCIITPHVAFYSEESLKDLQRRAAMNIAAVCAHVRPSSIINDSVLALTRWSHLDAHA